MCGRDWSSDVCSSDLWTCAPEGDCDLLCSGKIMRRKANHNHLLEHKSTARKRRLTKATAVSEVEAENVRLMLPYLK